MFLTYYGLREQPFGDTPNPLFLVKTETHSRVLMSLFSHTDAGARVQTILADPGMGKTTLLFALLNHVRGRMRTAFLYNSQVNRNEFLGFVVRAFGLEDRVPDEEIRRQQLEQFLLQQARFQSRVVVAVDEAHNLEAPVIEEIRQLVEHAPASLQVIIAGQLQLRERLQLSSLPKFQAAPAYELRPLNLRETIGYIRHRLAVAGHTGPDLFLPDALEAIAKESRGIPRIINMICFQALLRGVALQRQRIDRFTVLDGLERAGLRTPPEAARIVSSRTPSEAVTTVNPIPMPAKDSTTQAEQRKQDIVRGQESDSIALATVLRIWLGKSADIWTGTAGELVDGIATIDASQSARLRSLPPKDLFAFIDASSGALHSQGIEVEWHSRPGFPRLISLRLRGGPGSASATVISEPQQTREKSGAEPETKSAEKKNLPDAAAHAQVAPAAATEVGPQVIAGFPKQEDFGTDSSETKTNTATSRTNAIRIGVAAAALFLIVWLVIHASDQPSSQTSMQVVQAHSGSAANNSALIANLREAAAHGDADSQYALAVRYLDGAGVRQDQREGLKWLRRAAEQGNTNAQHELGTSLVAQKDVVGGYPWLALAGAAGNEKSRETMAMLTPKLTRTEVAEIRFQIGQMFSTGTGVARDNVSAYTWFQLAQAAGNQKAGMQKAALQAHMKRNEIAEARRRADEWLQQNQQR